MRYVRYIGPSHSRGITASDWRSVGVTADTVFWNAQNGFAVPLDKFSDDQIRRAIDPDPMLVITGDDEEFTPQPQAMDMVPEQFNAPRVDVLDTVGGEPSTNVVEPSGAPSNVPDDDNPPVAKARTSK